MDLHKAYAFLARPPQAFTKHAERLECTTDKALVSSSRKHASSLGSQDAGATRMHTERPACESRG
eukprot:10541084-Alexandrium_andersonii.AAC.1